MRINLYPTKWMPRILAAIVASTLLWTSGCSSKSVTLGTPQVSLTASAAAINLNGSVTLIATLSGGSAPIGVITFYQGSNSLQAIDITGKTSATTTVTTLAPGSNTITAVYGGDPNNNSVTSTAVTVFVSVPTFTAVSLSPALTAQGSPVTIVATVTGNGAPTGAVTFSLAGTSLGTVSLVPNSMGTASTATLVTSSLPIGVDIITATNTASGYYLASSATAVAQVHGALIPTTTTLSATPSGTAPAGTKAALTATVTPAAGSAFVLDGTVTFYDGAVNLGTAAITNGGSTIFSTKQLSTGPNALTAVYSGNVFYGTSTTATPTALTLAPYTGKTYINPLNVNSALAGSSGRVWNCPDPSIIKSQTGGVNTWYAYCTGDPLNGADVTANAGNAHLITIFTSSDLVNWTYIGDAFKTLPSWLAPGQELQTPAISFFGGVYHLYYYANSATILNSSFGPPPAVGVGTAATPAGPFTDAGAAVVAPQLGCGNGCNRTIFSPEIINDGTGQQWITFGGSFGGISIRKLNASGSTSDPATEINIGVDNYYTAPYILARNGYFYEFVTAGSCCSGGISTYGVHVGRSTSITGPYFDKEGNDVNAFTAPAIVGDPGGDPVLVMNGNAIVGSGSNTVITDESGQDYIVYSGVDQGQGNVPNYAPGFLTARQLMMDALDYTSAGWPVARGGNGPSDYLTPQPYPAAQPGQTSGYNPSFLNPDLPGTLLAAYSDDFNLPALNRTQWSFLHSQPPYTMSGTAYTVQSVNAESTSTAAGFGMSSLPILTELAPPTGNYIIEVKLATSDPPTGYIFNFNQGGIFLYNTDADYLRLDQVPVYETRQIEFLNSIPGCCNAFAPVGDPNFGASTYFRLAKRSGTGFAGSDTYTAYSSSDGITWLKGPTWIKFWGTTTGLRIGLFAGNTSGYTASFDYVHVSTLLP